MHAYNAELTLRSKGCTVNMHDKVKYDYNRDVDLKSLETFRARITVVPHLVRVCVERSGEGQGEWTRSR